MEYLIKPKSTERIDILKEYADYGGTKSDIQFEYLFNERENMLDIIENHNLDELVQGKTDAESAIALMNWLCGRYRHGNPPYSILGKDSSGKQPTPQVLMAAADEWEGRTNCRGLSLILVQLLRAFNIKAFHVTCMPYEQPFDDCHVVVSVYSESLGRHIMLDPTHNLYIRNKTGDIIGIEEFRDILLADEKTVFNDDCHGGFVKEDKRYNMYMAKNLIRIERYIKSGYGLDGDAAGRCILVSEKYMENETMLFEKQQQKLFVTSRKWFWSM